MGIDSIIDASRTKKENYFSIIIEIKHNPEN